MIKCHFKIHVNVSMMVVLEQEEVAKKIVLCLFVTFQKVVKRGQFRYSQVQIGEVNMTRMK